MKTQHTKGEWGILEEEHVFYVGSTLKARNILFESAPHSKHDLLIGYEENKANAKLIAAAPDLLKALIELRKIAEKGGANCKGQAITPEMFEILTYQAIKKATE